MTLKVKQISASYGSSPVLNKLSFEVKPGEFFSVLGPSGSGKTTLLRTIAGLHLPSSGTIQLAGKDITTAAPNQRKIAWVPQEATLFPNLTIAQNVGFGIPAARGRKQAANNETVVELLKLVGLSEKSNAFPNQLSGGQQQRVSLARALAVTPELIMLDEPFSSLDAKLRVELRSEIAELLKAKNTTTILITHDQEEALSLSDRIALMKAGEILQLGTPAELYNKPLSPWIADFLGQAQFLSGTWNGSKAITGFGNFSPKNPDSELAQGAKCKVLVRAEEVTITASEANQLSLGEGEIVSAQFLGNQQLLRLKFANGATLKSLVRSSGNHRPGQKLEAFLESDRLIFPED